MKNSGHNFGLAFTILLGVDFWPLTHFEPIIVGIALHLSRHKPWRFRCTPILESVEGLCGVCHWLLLVGGRAFCGNFSFK